MSLFDAVTLPLKEGESELLLMIGEVFGGWGFTVQDATAVFQAPGVRKLWTTPRTLRVPESAVYDQGTDAVYVSNYDAYRPSRGAGGQSIARVSPSGADLDRDWLTGLNNPTGLCRTRCPALRGRGPPGRRDRSRGRGGGGRPSDPGSGEAQRRRAAPDGTLYVSDPQNDTIHRLVDGHSEAWLQTPDVVRPNGLLVMGDTLVVAANGDRCLKTVDLVSKEVRPVATLPLGIIDGVQSDGAGNYLVSVNEGRLVRVSPGARMTTLLDTTAPGRNIADFAFVPGRNLLLVPTFLDAAYRAWSWAG